MRLSFALLWAAVLVSASPAGAAEKKPGVRPSNEASAKKAADKASDKTPRAPQPSPPQKSAQEATARGAASDTAAADPPAGGKTSKKPRVYTFSGLDVEGKLKTPQLLYFRSRVKQELDTSTPEKRSFMKELEASAQEPGL